MSRLFSFLALLGLSIAAAQAQPPVLLSTLPARNTIAAAPGGPISLTFSLPIGARSASGNDLKVYGTQRGGLLSRPQAGGTCTGAGTDTLTFQPAQPFQPGELIHVTASALLTDPLGSPLANPQTWQFLVAAGPGPATFSRFDTVKTGGDIQQVKAADFDGDGDLDLVTANHSNAAVSVRFNDGTGTFNTGAKVLVHGNPRTVVPADVDDDGDMDLLTSNSLTNQAAYVSVRLNNGLGQFLHGADHQVGQLLGTPARKATSVAVADLDADGSLDFVTTNTNGTVSVRFNQGQGAFGGSSDYPVGLNPSLVTTGDVDGDGDLDLLVTDTGTPAAPGQTVIILLNSGSGAFPSTYTVSVAGNPNHIATGDLDADGDLDLLTAHPLDHKVCIRFNDGAGGFTSPLDVLIPSSHRTDQPHTVATADLDGDGDLDFYTANHRSVAIGLNDGSGYFTVTPIIAGTWGAACATAADLDGDHDLDLLFPDGNAAASSISIYLNRPVPPLGVGGAILPALSLNPNPARHYVRVLGAPARDIYLLNALGQVIRTCSLLPASPEATLDLTGIAPGVYFVRCGPDTRRLAVE